MTDIIFASHNQGKIKEAQTLLEPFGYRVLSADNLHLEDVEENGTTFAENALIKARAAFKATGRPALADDSGLCVHALGDEPGIYTACYAKKMGGHQNAFGDLLMRAGNDTSAHFTCVIAYVDETGEYTFEGRVDGHLSEPQEGNEGFGFDPIFVPNGYDKAFSCLDSKIKNSISHRAKALQQLKEFIQR